MESVASFDSDSLYISVCLVNIEVSYADHKTPHVPSLSMCANNTYYVSTTSVSKLLIESVPCVCTSLALFPFAQNNRRYATSGNMNEVRLRCRKQIETCIVMLFAGSLRASHVNQWVIVVVDNRKLRRSCEVI